MSNLNYIYQGPQLKIDKNITPETFNLKDYKSDREPVLVARKTSEVIGTHVPHIHNYYELLIMVSGEVLHYFNGITYHLKERTICLIRPKDVHFYLSHPESGSFHLINCAFPLSLLEDTLEFLSIRDFDVPGRPLSMIHVFDELNYKMYMKYIEEIETYHQDYTQKERVFKLMLADILNNMETGTSSLSTVPSWLTNAYQQMKTPENLILGLNQLVKLSGKSQEHLTRASKKHFGISPSHLINQLRTHEAAKQLELTRKPIITIALDIGYNTMSYFNDAFRKEYGINPSEYRKMKYKFV